MKNLSKPKELPKFVYMLCDETDIKQGFMLIENANLVKDGECSGEKDCFDLFNSVKSTVKKVEDYSFIAKTSHYVIGIPTSKYGKHIFINDKNKLYFIPQEDNTKIVIKDCRVTDVGDLSNKVGSKENLSYNEFWY